MKKILLAVLAICILPLNTWGQPVEIPPQRGITLLFSSNVIGETEPCG